METSVSEGSELNPAVVCDNIHPLHLPCSSKIVRTRKMNISLHFFFHLCFLLLNFTYWIDLRFQWLKRFLKNAVIKESSEFRRFCQATFLWVIKLSMKTNSSYFLLKSDVMQKKTNYTKREVSLFTIAPNHSIYF